MSFSIERPQRARSLVPYSLIGLALAGALTSHDASAGPSVGLDLEGSIPLSAPTHDPDSLHGGSGIKIRVGDQIHLPLWRVTPEVGFAYDRLFGDGGNQDDGYGWGLERVFAGARVGFGSVVVPTIYAHVGYGWRTTGDPRVPEGNGAVLDGGFALDLHLVRHFAFGAHTEYATVAIGGGTTPQWLAIGLHLDVAFF